MKARAVILHDGKLVVSREASAGRGLPAAPGEQVKDGELIAETLVRRVAGETGLDVLPPPPLRR
jgi:ADP-ribose pyrophosphatase YjhB (NUDIX family)